MTLLLRATMSPDGQGRQVHACAAGGHLRTLLAEACALAHKLECGITFDFNGHTVDVWPTSDVEECYQHYQWAWSHEAQRRHEQQIAAAEAAGKEQP